MCACWVHKCDHIGAHWVQECDQVCSRRAHVSVRARGAEVCAAVALSVSTQPVPAHSVHMRVQRCARLGSCCARARSQCTLMVQAASMHVHTWCVCGGARLGCSLCMLVVSAWPACAHLMHVCVCRGVRLACPLCTRSVHTRGASSLHACARSVQVCTWRCARAGCSLCTPVVQAASTRVLGVHTTTTTMCVLSACTPGVHNPSGSTQPVHAQGACAEGGAFTLRGCVQAARAHMGGRKRVRTQGDTRVHTLHQSVHMVGVHGAASPGRGTPGCWGGPP